MEYRLLLCPKCEMGYLITDALWGCKCPDCNRIYSFDSKWVSSAVRWDKVQTAGPYGKEPEQEGWMPREE